ncbi:MAG: VWA domain-containing protein [Armatimonadetes bacterium]|nr:VWA domain-containing protein [Armatimonadota bacterium]
MNAYRLGGVGLLVLLIGSCARSGLESLPSKGDRIRDDKLEIDGSLCTQEPESLVFPLRVLFIVDASQSMEVTDPADPVTLETRRERAVRETWQDLLNQGVAGVRIGVIRFSAQAQSRTPVLDANGIPTTYFTTDQTQLLAAGQAISITDRTTNYLNALAEAYFELRTE